MELVSVIIGTYNRYDLVLRAIDSVLNQTYKNIEIIVVDDCSTDLRYENLKNNKNIKFLSTTKNSRLPSVPRNIGINNSNGEWICFLDDDDYFLPSKIERQIEVTKKYDFVCSDAYYDDNLSLKYAKGLHNVVWEDKNPNNTFEFDFDLINGHNLIINSSVLVRKKLLLDIGLISEKPEYRRIEDYITWLDLLKNKTKFCYFIEEPLLFYNMNSTKF
jgi:glycosyltransferase involved in cell wall biosynthesis